MCTLYIDDVKLIYRCEDANTNAEIWDCCPLKLVGYDLDTPTWFQCLYQTVAYTIPVQHWSQYCCQSLVCQR